MRECKLNSCPANDVVDQLAVWVRIAGLLVEYYDQKVLTFIGNRIEKILRLAGILPQGRGGNMRDRASKWTFLNHYLLCLR